MSDSAPETVRFCPRCGSALETRPVGEKRRRACPACDYIHFTDPKVGVGVVVVEDDRLLLVRRAMAPEIGRWSLPAGFLDHGEDPRATAAREVLEETGLEVVLDGLVDVFFNARATVDGGASIFILYHGRRVGGRLAPGDDAAEAAFFERDSLPPLAFASTRAAVAAWLAGEKGT